MSDLLLAQKALDDLIKIHNELVITLPLIPIVYSERFSAPINRTAELVRNFNVFKLYKDDNLVHYYQLALLLLFHFFSFRRNKW